MKNILVVLILMCCICSIVNAQELKNLPFNIKIGVTKNEEVENRAVCVKKIKVSEYYFRCEEYEVAGKFKIFSSQNEVVTKIQFNAYLGHKLPSKWREIGLHLQVAGYDKTKKVTTNAELIEKGTSLEELRSILRSQGYSKFDERDFQGGTDVFIDIDGFEYSFRVQTDDGLFSINITETY